MTNLPDVSEALAEWVSSYTVKTVTQQTTDFIDTSPVVGRTVEAMVQVAEKEKLNPDQIDWSLRYLLIHSPEQLNAGEFIEYRGEDYKIIDDGDWLAYGYTEAVAEQTKRPVIQVTQ